METETNENKKTLPGRFKSWLFASPIGRLFIDRRFFNYTLIGVFISLLNIFLLWLLIDIFEISTVIASTLVIGSTFIFRYVLFRLFDVM